MRLSRIMGKMLCGTVLSGAMLVAAAPAYAQGAQDADDIDDVLVVTGTRIQNPGVTSASPITSIGQEELELQFSPNIERVFRDLPITIPGDGENVNNGTEGAATIDLRGLGPQRSLVLVDGKRLSPFDEDGQSDVSTIPLIMLERIDVITGGASAVYGSDAMAGAVNMVLRDDFEGLELDAGYSITDQGGGDIYEISALLGTNFADDRGNVTVGMNFTDRGQVLLEQRDFGLFGVSSATGAGLGAPPPAPDPACSGNSPLTTSFDSGVGSTTALPGSLDTGFGTFGLFDDGTVNPGAPLSPSDQGFNPFDPDDLNFEECSRFNFNPFNFYQTPQVRYQATAIANYEVNDHIEIYGRASFTSNSVESQIAPSGTFGEPFDIPFANPFLAAAAPTLIAEAEDERNDFLARNNAIIAAGVGGVIPGVTTPFDQDDIDAAADALLMDPLGFGAIGVTDLNENGIVDAADSFRSTARRRTVELGPRLSIFDRNMFQFVFGARGELPGMFEGWIYDLSWQRGETDLRETRDGFTNLTNLAIGINTVSDTQCEDPDGNVTPAPCSPINVFGPLGSITQEQRDSGYFIAIANDNRFAAQTVISGSLTGEVGQFQSPWANAPLATAFGFEYRKEEATSSPDLCLQQPPNSCQGGAGGNRLPIAGSYSVWEGFIEGIIPVIQDRPFFEEFSIEAGYRYSDFNIQGQTDTWKAGFSWQVTPSFRVRYMEQQAVRVPNVGELFSPLVTALDNATIDPCSSANTNISDELEDLCIATGVPAGQVGLIPNIIAGQISIFEGTDQNNLPTPETARTRTAGVVWQPDLSTVTDGLTATTLTVDYYNINIDQFIDTPTGQEALDLCYVLQVQTVCDGIVRINGGFTTSGAGVPSLFTNFEFFRAEGIEVGFNTGYDLGALGVLTLGFNANRYLTNEFQTTEVSPVVDCNGFYGTSCDPVPTFRSTTRLSYNNGPIDLSLLWRRIGAMQAQENEAESLFEAFRSVDAQNYFDLTAGFEINDNAYVSGQVRNLANTNPPILGNNTGTTDFNSGNTFPSLYDTLGRVYSININLRF